MYPEKPKHRVFFLHCEGNKYNGSTTGVHKFVGKGKGTP
jgi:hypothetical protein